MVKKDEWKALSLELGLSYSYLVVFKKNHNLKDMSASEVRAEYILRHDKQDRVINDIQLAFYWLEEHKLIHEFGYAMKEANITTTDKSVWNFFQRRFKNINTLMCQKHIDRFEKIVELFKNFKTKYEDETRK